MSSAENQEGRESLRDVEGTRCSGWCSGVEQIHPHPLSDYTHSQFFVQPQSGPKFRIVKANNQHFGIRSMTRKTKETLYFYYYHGIPYPRSPNLTLLRTSLVCVPKHMSLVNNSQQWHQWFQDPSSENPITKSLEVFLGCFKCGPIAKVTFSEFSVLYIRGFTSVLTCYHMKIWHDTSNV